MAKDKKQKKSKSVDKYFTGGSIKSPDTTLAENEMMWARADAKAASNPWTTAMDIAGTAAMSYGMGMMNSGMSQGQGMTEGGFNWGSLLQGGIQGGAAMGVGYATGGIVRDDVPIEVEGEEVIETPDGTIQEIEGPSHEQGGVDIEVPEDTEVYSKRLKGPDGKTMAQRKLKREKQLDKIAKLLEKNPGDTVIKKTYNRVKANNDKLDSSDMEQMEAYREAQLPTEEFATGGRVPATSLAGSITPQGYMPNVPNNSFSMPTNYRTATPQGTSNQGGFNFGNLGATFGDILGMAGQYKATTDPMKLAQEMRATDKPNQNFFKDYGKDALKKLDKTKKFMESIRDNKLQSNELNRRTATTQNRNTSRGINTMRALDIASQGQKYRADMDAYDMYGNAMANIYGQEANMLLGIDNVVMGAEHERDTNDRKDRAAYFSALSNAQAQKNYGMQQMGKSFNQMKNRNNTANTLNTIYPNFKVDPYTGEIIPVEDN